MKGKDRKEKYIYLVVGLSVLSLIIAFVLACHNQLTPTQFQLFETCSTTYKMVLGAIIALILDPRKNART